MNGDQSRDKNHFCDTRKGAAEKEPRLPTALDLRTVAQDDGEREHVEEQACDEAEHSVGAESIVVVLRAAFVIRFPPSVHAAAWCNRKGIG